MRREQSARPQMLVPLRNREPFLEHRCRTRIGAGALTITSGVCHESGDIRCDEVPDPRIEDGRDAILKVTACAICGSDLHLMGGFVPEMKSGDVLGHECMGEVVEVGRDNKRLKVGNRVVIPFCPACGECRMCRMLGPLARFWARRSAGTVHRPWRMGGPRWAAGASTACRLRISPRARNLSENRHKPSVTSAHDRLLSAHRPRRRGAGQ